MLKDRMKTTSRTKTFKHKNGSPYFKARTVTITCSTDEQPDRTDVTLWAKEFYSANGRGHTSVDVHVTHSERTGKVQAFDLDDGVYSIIVAGVSLFLNRTQFAELRSAIYNVDEVA